MLFVLGEIKQTHSTQIHCYVKIAKNRLKEWDLPWFQGWLTNDYKREVVSLKL